MVFSSSESGGTCQGFLYHFLCGLLKGKVLEKLGLNIGLSLGWSFFRGSTVLVVLTGYSGQFGSVWYLCVSIFYANSNTRVDFSCVCVCVCARAHAPDSCSGSCLINLVLMRFSFLCNHWSKV